MFRNVLNIASSSLIAMLLLVAAQSATSASAQALPVDAHMNALLRGAKAPADHQLAATYFQAQANQYEAEAAVHQAMLAAYRADATRVTSKNQAETIGHCEYLVQELQHKAVEAQRLGRMNEQMASATEPASPQTAPAPAKAGDMPGMTMAPSDKPAATAKPMGGMMCGGDKAAAKSDSMSGMQMPADAKAAPKASAMAGMKMGADGTMKDCDCCAGK